MCSCRIQSYRELLKLKLKKKLKQDERRPPPRRLPDDMATLNNF